MDSKNDLNTDIHSDRPRQTAWVQASQWMTRTLAIAVVMVGPGILGSYLDQKIGTSFLGMTGFVFGLVVGTIGLLVLARRFTPKARGKPLAWPDDEEAGAESDDVQDENR